MNILTTGIILNTENYDACVEFYQTLFDLKILFQKNDGDFRLTCFEFGGAYLMVETGGVAVSHGKAISQSAAKLRFNVEDIGAALRRLKKYGIDTEIISNNWGDTIDFHDPDGNRIGFRDEVTYIEQVKSGEGSC